MNGEPTLDQIDDYNGNESKEKRTTVRLVIAFCIAICMIYGIVKYTNNSVDEYIGTTQKPGINTSKN